MCGAVGKGAGLAVEEGETGRRVEGDTIGEWDGEGAEDGIVNDRVIVWREEEPPCAVNVREEGFEYADFVECESGLRRGGRRGRGRELV